MPAPINRDFRGLIYRPSGTRTERDMRDYMARTVRLKFKVQRLREAGVSENDISAQSIGAL